MVGSHHTTFKQAPACTQSLLAVKNDPGTHLQLYYLLHDQKSSKSFYYASKVMWWDPTTQLLNKRQFAHNHYLLSKTIRGLICNFINTFCTIKSLQNRFIMRQTLCATFELAPVGTQSVLAVKNGPWTHS